MIVLNADRITIKRPEKPLFSDISLTIQTGDRLGVVGINGSGKSTLLKVLAGEINPDEGEIRRGRSARVAMLTQDPKLAPGTVHNATTSNLEHANVWEAEAILDHLGMSNLVNADTSTLSGGQTKRVALARALVSDSDLLILDEPTNHLDLDAIAWLEDRLAKYRGALILVSHDRHLLDRVCTKVFELDRGAGYLHEGGYQGYLLGRDAREERAATQETTRRNLAKTELAWLRRGAPARTRKSKARIDSATTIVEGRAQAAARSDAFELGAATSRSGDGQGPSAGSQQGSYRNSLDEKLMPRLGNKVIEITGIGHHFDDANGNANDWLFRDLELLLAPGESYGIVGANGTGKSTLLEILSTRLKPTEGTVETGPTVRVGYYDQKGRELDPKQRVREAVAGPARPVGTPEDKRLMEQFWFVDDGQFTPIGELSGGERRRLQLLLVLAERPNVLLLDEPTNDLDLDTIRAFEDFLETWPGTLVVVSHDRTFMDRTVTEVLAIENHKASLVTGGYAGWREQREARLGTVTNKRSLTSSTNNARNDSVANTNAPARSANVLRQLLKDTEKEVSKLTKLQARLTAELETAGTDHAKITEIGTKISDAMAAITDAETRWLELATEADQ